jgi:hypothetical protein
VAAGAAIAAGSAAVVCLPFASGPAGLLGVLLTAAGALVSGLAMWAAVPEAIVALVPTLVPAPIVFYTFAWEWALASLLVAVVLHASRHRAAWALRLEPVEWWLLLFTAWALFTGFWCTSTLYYLLGVRRLVVALGTLWVAMRLPHIASRRWFDLGLVGAASALALAAIQHSLGTGFSQMQALLHRAQVTDLGWGTANYVATLLLLCAPSLLRLVLRGSPRERLLGGVGFTLATVVEFIVASRAAVVLFSIGTIVQLLHATRRHRLVTGLAALGALAAILASPLGAGLLSRLGSLREMGSMTIRIWYFREGFRRLIEFLPWGMGLGQGYVNADHLHGIDPHDYWLLVGGDLGIPGLVLWAAVQVAIVRGWLAVRADARQRELAFTMLLTFTLGNLHTLVEPTFQGGQYQLLFLWIVCGSLAYAQAEAADARTSLHAAGTGPRAMAESTGRP